MGTMAKHNTQNGQKCCDHYSPFKTTAHKGCNFPCSEIITQIVRRRICVPRAPWPALCLQSAPGSWTARSRDIESHTMCPARSGSCSSLDTNSPLTWSCWFAVPEKVAASQPSRGYPAQAVAQPPAGGISSPCTEVLATTCRVTLALHAGPAFSSSSETVTANHASAKERNEVGKAPTWDRPLRTCRAAKGGPYQR